MTNTNKMTQPHSGSQVSIVVLTVMFLCMMGYADEFVVEGDLTVQSNLFVSGDSVVGDRNSVEGYAIGTGATAAGRGTTVSGSSAHAEGYRTLASGGMSHAEGFLTKAEDKGAHAEGFRTESLAIAAHAEGVASIASGRAAHAEGWKTEATGQWSHAEGYLTVALGVASHSAGESTIAFGQASYAGGVLASASHDYTFVWSASDDQLTQVCSTSNRQFVVYAPNGIRLLGGVVEGDGSALTNLSSEACGDLSMGSFTNRP